MTFVRSQLLAQRDGHHVVVRLNVATKDLIVAGEFDPEGKGPNLSLDQYPERRTAKRSRLHLDLYTDSRDLEVERLVKLGATRYRWR